MGFTIRAAALLLLSQTNAFSSFGRPKPRTFGKTIPKIPSETTTALKSTVGAELSHYARSHTDIFNVLGQNQAWVERTKSEIPGFFDKLGSGHSPKYLWIGCADARVPDNVLMGENAGSVFVCRNVANLVVNTDHNLMSAMQYAVAVLKVPHVIVCGHYDCGGVRASTKNVDHTAPLENWLRNIRDTYRLHRSELDAISDPETRHRRLVELNVIEQCINVFKTGPVQQRRTEAMKDGAEPFSEPRIHACVYDPKDGLLRELEVDISKYAQLGTVYGMYEPQSWTKYAQTSPGLLDVMKNNQRWVNSKKAEDPSYFDKLGSGHNPSYLWIGCSDARVSANLATGEEAGQVFVVRNVANMVVNTDFNLMSAMEYAVSVLQVPHIIVCGHYDCGGVRASTANNDHGAPLENWLRNIRDTYRLHRQELDAISDPEQRHRRLVELNVIEQALNVFKTGAVQRRRMSTMKDDSAPFTAPVIHACVFDPKDGYLRELEVDFEEKIDNLSSIYGLYQLKATSDYARNNEDISNVLQQNEAWRTSKAASMPGFFDKLGTTHQPTYMWIGCSDARVPDNVVMGEELGNVFVIRNVANMVVNTDHSLMSALQYAVAVLNVPHIIVCGHYECGGVRASEANTDHGAGLEGWLRNIRDTYRLHQKELDAITDPEARHRRLVDLNVIEQCINVAKTAAVQKRRVETMQDGSSPFTAPRIHACVFDPNTGLLKEMEVNFDDYVDDMESIYGLYGVE